MRRRRKTRKSIHRKGYTVANVGRNWPASTLVARFENEKRIKCLSTANNVASYSLLEVQTRPDLAGVRVWHAGDAAGTGGSVTPQVPRNWAIITPLYKRARPISTKIVIEAQVPKTDALQANWIGYFWISSILDAANPVAALTGNVGSAAPFQADETMATSLRHLLDMSRRVVKIRLRSTVSGGAGVIS